MSSIYRSGRIFNTLEIMVINSACFIRKGNRGQRKRNGGIAFRTRNICSLVTRERKTRFI